MVAPAEARAILSAEGWLSRQPEAFQADVYAGSTLVHFAAGETVYRYGDPLGGLYGIVSGALLVIIGPPDESPHPCAGARPLGRRRVLPHPRAPPHRPAGRDRG